MGYSKTPKSVLKVRKYLDRLVSTDDDIIVWETPNPKRLAYLIRQGMYAAKFNRTDFEGYLHLSVDWKIREGTSFVSAERVNIPPAREVQVTSKPIEQEKLTIEEVHTLTQVLGAVTKLAPDVDLYFPNAVLLLPEQERLNSWADQKNREIVYHEGAGLTVRSLSAV